MGIEELLPGMVRMMDERFGRMGRPITTVLLFLLAMAIMAWCLGMIWDKFLAPVLKFFGIEFAVVSAELGADVFLMALAMIVTVAILGMLVVSLTALMSYVLRFLIDKLQSSKNLIERAELDQIRHELLELPDLSPETREQLEGITKFEPELSGFERWRIRMLPEDSADG